jgi:hypothetical protein
MISIAIIDEIRICLTLICPLFSSFRLLPNQLLNELDERDDTETRYADANFEGDPEGDFAKNTAQI